MTGDDRKQRIEYTDLPEQEGLRDRRRLLGDKPLSDEEMIERFKKTLALGRENKVRSVIVSFELDPNAPPRSVTWFSGTPRTMFGSCLIGMVDLLHLLLVESGCNRGAPAGVLRHLARLAAGTVQDEGCARGKP